MNNREDRAIFHMQEAVGLRMNAEPTEPRLLSLNKAAASAFPGSCDLTKPKEKPRATPSWVIILKATSQ